ncbi:EndoU domain-containing protein [Mumia sp. zg.B53]|uniref:polymorphic toxin-type HINT domain-containing protein n=1 Tax=Mumia sp. zg.B53 TaxID=2855449 RepID=UPI001C6F2137|nr:polymorphic toxin-type HINT domain-containing protein [Mumia sp. zg.B53]MBW9215130.1 EndoU domain-containing protein [Mumia sp. zg.B53]
MTDEYRRALSAVSTSNAQETECRSRKSIEDVTVGDLVMASDPQTDEQAPRRVEAVHVHKDTVTDIKVDGEVITTTEDHPFWSVDSQTFERADELTLGERVLSADGKKRAVSGVVGARAGRRALAYNLSIQGIHTYHVGALDVLVHNMCATGGAAKSADEFVDLASASRRSHILDGHRYGGEAGNTWFPKGWSDDKIMHSISDIATDPSLNWVQQTGRAGAAVTRGGSPVRYTVEGVRDGVKMRGVLEPGGEGIITGFPIP